MRRSTLCAAPILWLLLALCACSAREQAPAISPATSPASTFSLRAGVSVRVGEATLDYRDLGGPGRPLLLITGYAVTLDMWDPDFVRELAARRRVILMDNRGMGAAKAPDGPISIGQMARDAIGLLEILGIAKADVLGWSMGGVIAQEMALARPDLVATLTLCATMADNAQLMPMLDRMAGMSPGELQQAMFPKAWADAHPDVFARLPARTRPPDLDVIGRQYAALKQWRGSLRDLPNLRCPVLLLGGTEDWISPPENLRSMARAIPGARLELLPEAGHWMMHQYPLHMARLVNAFLAQAAAAESPRPTACGWIPFRGRSIGLRAEYFGVS